MKKISFKLRKIPLGMVVSFSMMAILTSCGAQMDGYTETDGLYYNPKKDIIPEKDWAPKIKNWEGRENGIAMEEEQYSITQSSKELREAQNKKYNKWTKTDKHSSDWGTFTGVERRYIETSPYDVEIGSFWSFPYNYHSLTWNSYFGYDWRFYSPWSYLYSYGWNSPYYYNYYGPVYWGYDYPYYPSPYYYGYRGYLPYYSSLYYDSYYGDRYYYPRTYQRKVYRESSADRVKRYESNRNEEGRMIESRVYRSENNNYQPQMNHESWNNTTYRSGDGGFSSSSNSSSSSSNNSNSGGFIKGDFK